MRATLSQRGFTLIELLVSIAIMALVSVGAFSLLTSTMVTGERVTARQQQLLGLERLQGVIANDLAQWVDRPLRYEFGDPLPPFVLAPDGSLEFTRRGLSNPLDKPRSDMLRVRYELRGDQLWRLSWNTLDRMPGMLPSSTPLGPAGVSLRWQVQAAPGSRQQSVWPSTDSGATGQSRAVLTAGAPEIVNLVLRLQPWGEIRRVYALPSHDPQ